MSYTTKFAAKRAAEKAIATGKAPGATYVLTGTGKEIEIEWQAGAPAIDPVAADLELMRTELLIDPMVTIGSGVMQDRETELQEPIEPPPKPRGKKATAKIAGKQAPAGAGRQKRERPATVAKSDKRASRPSSAAPSEAPFRGVRGTIVELLSRRDGATEREVAEALSWKRAGATVGRTIKAAVATGTFMLEKQRMTDGRGTRYRLVPVEA
jgi:hypothetical protein